MANAENPFDDPEVARMMAEHGITHRPGMAAELMKELAPLLAADGIDLDNLGPDVTLEELNAAMGRATEQHNLSLFTPVADERETTLATLAEFAEALTEKRTRRAENVLDSIQPEPTPGRPAGSHMIGVCLGLLDTWFTNAELRAEFGEITLPKWRGPARSTAATLIRAARTGDAFAMQREITVRHGGLFLMQAAAVAAAGTIVTLAARDEIPVADAAARLFTHGGVPAVPASPAPHSDGAAFGLAPGQSAATAAYLREYGEWAAADEPDTPTQAAELDLLRMLAMLAESEGLDLAVPLDVASFIDGVLEAEDPEPVTAILTVIDDYIHFRLDTAADPSRWEALHDSVADLLGETDDDEDETAFPEAFYAAINASVALPDSETVAALAQIPVVAGVYELLDWIGTSAPITSTGGLRRADIERVAAMIGVSAVGVASIPDADAGASSDTIYARSSKDVPELAAWWAGLIDSEIIEITPTRVRPGVWAADFDPATPLDIESASKVVIGYLGELLTHGLSSADPAAHALVLAVAIDELVSIIAGVRHVSYPPLLEDNPSLRAAALELLAPLERLGLIQREGNTPIVPVTLVHAVSAGLSWAITDLNEFFDEVSP